MSSYGKDIDSSSRAWRCLNRIANLLGTDYTMEGIMSAAKEVQRQRTTRPRDAHENADGLFGSFGELTQHRSMVIYANRCGEQNIRELPNIWELHGCHSKMGNPKKNYGLGAIWYYDDWLASLGPYRERHNSKLLDAKVADDLYVDADPEWKKFIDLICKKASQEGLDLILFYWS